MTPLVWIPFWPSFVSNKLTIFSKDIRLLGQMKHGVYDQADEVDPAMLHRYYGATRPSANITDENDGPTSGDEDEESQRDIAQIITDSQSRNIQHEAAAVARNSSPFQDQHDVYAFTLALEAALESGAFPAGFNLNEEYESFEAYKTGHSAKPLIIPLPRSVWFPRIIVWCRSLDLLKRFQMCKELSL